MEFQVGQEIEFNIYGNELKGKYISESDRLVKIEVTYDGLGSTEVGQICEIHKFYIKIKI